MSDAMWRMVAEGQAELIDWGAAKGPLVVVDPLEELQLRGDKWKAPRREADEEAGPDDGAAAGPACETCSRALVLRRGDEADLACDSCGRSLAASETRYTCSVKAHDVDICEACAGLHTRAKRAEYQADVRARTRLRRPTTAASHGGRQQSGAATRGGGIGAGGRGAGGRGDARRAEPPPSAGARGARAASRASARAKRERERDIAEGRAVRTRLGAGRPGEA